MSKIDLLDQKWIDLVFEGKNEAYGAYTLRQDTSKRNFFAMMALIIGLIAIVATFLIVNVASEAIARAQAEHETEVTLEQIEEEVEEQEEEEIVYELEELEQLVAEETVMNSENETVVTHRRLFGKKNHHRESIIWEPYLKYVARLTETLAKRMGELDKAIDAGVKKLGSF